MPLREPPIQQNPVSERGRFTQPWVFWLNSIVSCVNAIRGVPAGGTSGQALSKLSDDDYSMGWVDVSTGASDGIGETYETISKNLKASDGVFSYAGDVLSSVVYTSSAGVITKTLNYTGGTLTSVVLSGDTPAGIDLTKALSYTGDKLTGVSYS